MPYRYNTVDIVVGVGLCAIVFGAMLVFVAASGSFVVTAPSLASIEPFADGTGSMVWLQPALGQAIVERALLQRRTDQITVAAASEWNRAMEAYRSLQALGGDPFGFVTRRAEIVPIEHDARVQGVMGRHIANFTKRGVRSGLVSADLYLSDYNRDMIALTEAMGRRLDGEFAATWQPLLGRWIVEAGQNYLRLVAGVQEELGQAIVHRAQATTALEDAWAANQYQVGSLMAAVDRSTIAPVRQVAVATAKPRGEAVSVASTRPVTWPEMPVGYLIAAAVGLCAVFLVGLTVSAASREAKAMAEAKRHAARWVYRMAT